MSWLLDRIRNWFSSRILNRHRLLFRFWDGSRFVSADPFVLMRRLMTTDKFDPEAALKSIQIPDAKVITKNIGWIAEGVREIFELPAFKDGGLTELECLNLLGRFTAYLEDVKKNGGSNLISQLSMGRPEQDVGEAAENAGNSSSGST